MAGSSSGRDPYPDALRAGALLVVVFGHWLATLPRFENGQTVATDHILEVWANAGYLTWVLQVVPMFVFVSAAVTVSGAERRLRQGHRQLHWWGGRALGLARPVVTYMAVLAVMVVIAEFSGGRLLGPLDQSLTVHLWFLLMLLFIQALFPVAMHLDNRFGLWAIAGMVGIAAIADWVRAGLPSPAALGSLGDFVTATSGGFGWVNMLVVWLIPQQLGVAWKRRRFEGWPTGLLFFVAAGLWLTWAVSSGYPAAMVGGDIEGNSNVLPPTLALVGVMWLQVGAVLVLEPAARRLLSNRNIAKAVSILGALGMALYLWHKLAELPAAWLGERFGIQLDAGGSPAILASGPGGCGGSACAW